MQSGIKSLIGQLQDTYEGDPWFGRSVKELLGEVTEQRAFEIVNHQHSIVELVWHMITWREFIIDRIQPKKSLAYFEENDWRDVNHQDKTLWQKGLRRLQETQEELIALFETLDDSILDQPVKEKTYDFRKLLNGLVQHDIYHLGQIAFINKALMDK